MVTWNGHKMDITDNEECDSISNYMIELIKSRGYPLEIHNITTEDGYIVSVYRVPYGLVNNDSEKSRCPVLIVHGLCSSVAEIFNNEDQLGYFLANRGFDVWAVNCRGTTFSRGHTEFDQVQQPEKYWNFSFHEIGYYDIAAVIDEILRVTGFEKLFYIGISQGTTAFTVLMSTRPEYNKKIALACLLCPGIKFEHARMFPMKLFFEHLVPWIQYVRQSSYTEIPFMDWIRYFGRNYAKPNSIAEYFHMKLFDLLCGHANPDRLKNMDFRRISIPTPNTASTMQMLHFSQVIRANRFAQFDLGPSENLQKYGCESPPAYDLSNLNAPVGIFYSQNDMFYGSQVCTCGRLFNKYFSTLWTFNSSPGPKG